MYQRTNSVPGAWTATLRGPAIPHDYFVAALRAVARDCPLSGWTRVQSTEISGGMVVLHRHPSQRHGTPAIEQCDAAAEELADRLGWGRDWGVPQIGIVTGVGLREGYADSAIVHDRIVVDELLGGLATMAVTQWSARAVDGKVQWYDEPAIMVNTGADRLPLITAAAAKTAQHQIVVTDYAADVTYTLRAEEPGRG